MINEYAHILLNLFAVLALIVVSLFILRKIKTSRYGTNKHHIDIIQVLPIGPKEKILLVKAQNTLLLLGATSTHIEVLHVFDPADFPSESIKSQNAFSETMLTIYNKNKSNEKDVSLA